MTLYRTIVADPPWLERGSGKSKRGADKHYPLMATDDIVRLMRHTLEGKIHDDAHLYLWVTNNFLPDGLVVMAQLGFRYVTCITWMKDKIGLGQYFRGITEHCLFGVRGKVEWKYTVGGQRAQGRTGFKARRQAHSQKPGELYNMAVIVSHPPRLEMFARSDREGWDVWGNEISEE